MAETNDERDQKQKQREFVQSNRDTVELLKAGFEQQVELHTYIAKMYKAKYDALVEAGFKEDQALEIIKARGTNH